MVLYLQHQSLHNEDEFYTRFAPVVCLLGGCKEDILREAPGPVQLPSQWVPGALFPRVERPRMKLTTSTVPPFLTHLHGVVFDYTQGQI
jgi:hypothetical protein